MIAQQDISHSSPKANDKQYTTSKITIVTASECSRFDVLRKVLKENEFMMKNVIDQNTFLMSTRDPERETDFHLEFKNLAKGITNLEKEIFDKKSFYIFAYQLNDFEALRKIENVKINLEMRFGQNFKGVLFGIGSNSIIRIKNVSMGTGVLVQPEIEGINTQL
jgi:hypothetical protein